jgi:hypothetical protein
LCKAVKMTPPLLQANHNKQQRQTTLDSDRDSDTDIDIPGLGRNRTGRDGNLWVHSVPSGSHQLSKLSNGVGQLADKRRQSH